MVGFLHHLLFLPKQRPRWSWISSLSHFFVVQRFFGCLSSLWSSIGSRFWGSSVSNFFDLLIRVSSFQFESLWSLLVKTDKNSSFVKQKLFFVGGFVVTELKKRRLSFWVWTLTHLSPKMRTLRDLFGGGDLLHLALVLSLLRVDIGEIHNVRNRMVNDFRIRQRMNPISQKVIDDLSELGRYGSISSDPLEITAYVLNTETNQNLDNQNQLIFDQVRSP